MVEKWKGPPREPKYQRSVETEREKEYKPYEKERIPERIITEAKLPEYEQEIERIPEERRRAEVRTTQKAMVREVISGIEPLQTVGSALIGDLFDRVSFLRQRIAELNAAISDRKLLNKTFIQDIDADITEKERMLSALSNKDDIRELQLDVSLLKMERRKENMSFWKDIVTLRQELQQLMEQYEVESKISNIFSKLR